VVDSGISPASVAMEKKVSMISETWMQNLAIFFAIRMVSMSIV
jgi:hypothetical protein